MPASGIIRKATSQSLFINIDNLKLKKRISVMLRADILFYFIVNNFLMFKQLLMPVLPLVFFR